MESKTPADVDGLIEAYRTAKAEHDAAITALKQAANSRVPPDPELVRRQAAAAMAEFEALAALRGVAS